MTDLSHWDWADHFDSYDAAALILGLEPRESQDDQHRVRIVQDRMASDYQRCHIDYSWSTSGSDDPNIEEVQWVKQLQSVQMETMARLNHQTEDDTSFRTWLESRQSEFGNQKFARKEIARWISAIGMKSHYEFGSGIPTPVGGTSADAYLDPADFPEELSAANIAFRAVTNGYGDSSSRFRIRLMAFLRERYSSLSDDAIERVATVANPDKAPGRRKSLGN